MVIFLIAIIATLIAVIIYLNVQFYKEKRMFKIKLESLQQTITERSARKNSQANQLKLSEALDQKLKSDNATLSHAIFGLHFELFDRLSKNNLLKK